jgi:hypothetical protein
LRTKHDRQAEAFGVLRAGFCGVDHDPQIVGGDDQRVAVERDEADLGMIDDLVPPRVLVRVEDVARLPEFDESGAAGG